jgi:pyruvate/2-oxoglutarate dehydrogenase complex dihydrolipoamide dehydrogenase (E3) component
VCVIGGGSAGLSAAAGAAQLGARVVLIEKGEMGGDCLNTGCVPSKSLIAAAHAAHAYRTATRFGVGDGQEPIVDFPLVHRHIHEVIASIAPHDSVERFEGLGVTVLQGAARFTGPAEIEVGGERISARRFVVSTGSSAAVPRPTVTEKRRPVRFRSIVRRSAAVSFGESAISASTARVYPPIVVGTVSVFIVVVSLSVFGLVGVRTAVRFVQVRTL